MIFLEDELQPFAVFALELALLRIGWPLELSRSGRRPLKGVAEFEAKGAEVREPAADNMRVKSIITAGNLPHAQLS